jgi:multidrug resistance efflux pump
MKRGGVALVAVAALLIAALLWSQRARGPLVVSGFLEADEIRLGSLVGGRVAKVLVEEGAKIQQSDVLVELEPFDLREQLAEAQSQLTAHQAQLSRLQAGFRIEEIAQARARRDELNAKLEELRNGPRPQEIDEARAQVELAEAQLELAELELQRLQKLVESDVVSREDVDRATTEQQVALSRRTAVQARLALLLEGTRPEAVRAAEANLAQADEALKLKENGYRSEDIRQAQAAVQSAEATLAAIGRRLSELTIRATVDGTVEAIELQPGDLVAANAPVISLLDPSRLWVRAYVPESHLQLSLGQELSLAVNSYPGELFRGHVSFIAREAEFTPSNVQTPEERAKQVFRIRVELDEGLDRLRPGMSADVYLEPPSARQ